MIETFFNSPAFDESVALLEQGHSLFLGSLWETASAYLTAALKALLKRPIVVITKEKTDTRFSSDLFAFSNQLISLPAWDTLPTEALRPSLDSTGRRYEALKKLSEMLSAGLAPIVVTSAKSLCQKIPSPEALNLYSKTLKKGERISFEALGKLFLEIGYEKVPVVQDKGQFAVRKGLFDIFDIAQKAPYRLEFFDDEIESIRLFDPLSQKSIENIDSAALCPALDSDLVYEDAPARLIDYFDTPPILIFEDVVAIEDHAVFLANHKTLTLSNLFEPFSEALKHLDKCLKVFLSTDRIEKLMPKKGPLELFGMAFKIREPAPPFMRIEEALFLKETPSLDSLPAQLLEISSHRTEPMRLAIAYDNTGEERALKESLLQVQSDQGLKVDYVRGYVSQGFGLRSKGRCNELFIPYCALSKQYKLRTELQRQIAHSPAEETFSPVPGDLVVHYHSGVGKYLGIEKKTNHEGESVEFLALEFAKGSKLFVPMTQAYLLSPYVGASESRPSLDALGSNRWQSAKVKTQKAIVGYAKKLIELYAERTLGKEHPYSEDSAIFKEFEESFPYTETEDQLKAIRDVKADMLSPNCMDRLVCGDVGYGKTEVAMRAAFKAVCDGSAQVAVLVPTTVLALQHAETFKERMSGFPVRIDVLSRAKTPKEAKATLEKVKKGEIDILIGTHRLISKDVEFKKLALIVIDEEQRFGVRAKEKLKMAKKRTDCLTLTATPIPRTLHLSMSGAKEMSVIATPPQNRIPVQMVICEFNEDVIRDAILRELSREGQIYFIHNRVDSILKRKEHLEKIVPELRVGVAHGQMDPDRLDEVFHAFKEGELDLLLATTLIENGIDIPNANTIFVERADRHGLSDLYQIKGRVGRSSRASYAYFMTEENRTLREEAQKRLKALASAGSFGGGMKVALRDLEIRGAGDIIGTDQSGQVATIGFHLYCRLLKRAVNALKGSSSGDWIDTKLEFPFKANLSEEYIPSSALRLELYHRFAEVTEPADVDQIFYEMQDRYGKAPEPAIWLYHMMRIKAFASKNHWVWIKIEPLRAFAHKQSSKGIKAFAFPLNKTDDPKMLADALIEHLEKKGLSNSLS